MLKKIGLKSPVAMGVSLVCFGVGGLLSGELDWEHSVTAIVSGLGLLGVQLTLPTKTGK